MEDTIGKTCKIYFYTPECLSQCYSCIEKGNGKNHLCLGCKDNYYMEAGLNSINNNFLIPHNCIKCNNACYTCYGPEFENNTIKVNNCKKCNLDYDYFPFENDIRICFNIENAKIYEKEIGHGLFLDTTGKSKDKWIWRNCHYNCEKCNEHGDENNNKCSNETKQISGYYIKEDKLYQCLENCEFCSNATICQKCHFNYYKSEDNKSCNKICGHFYAYDNELMECVNCKSKYEKEKYTLNQTCINSIPEGYHVVNKTNNKICKINCMECNDYMNINKCTKCSKNFYKEDFFGIDNPKSFYCFNETQCKGIHKLEDNTLIGGVPIIENNIEICLNVS